MQILCKSCYYHIWINKTGNGEKGEREKEKSKSTINKNDEG